MKKTTDESIAIVGMGCRFPGRSSDPRAFWDLLCRGTDAIVDVPPERWDLKRFYSADADRPGKTYMRQGGFLQEKIDLFDPLFFGISPREAESMDPQQRLLLEVTWEAFEDAGIVPGEVAGSAAGVFIGGFCLDNQILRIGALNRELIDSHTATSSSMTILSNRISYVFNLKGPSVTLDTACSSSLVAVHLACQSLWSGESSLALAGGVNVMLRPEFPIVMSKGKFLSSHGRCMAFDERAEGYSRGEGAGVVLLKPLSRALEDRDPIYAVIRMTGVNQDGRTGGISLPDADSQENLIRSVYRRAGVLPADIGYVEAHGTGTRAGDPVEAGALHRVLSEGRRDGEKCLMGSLKTNMGHMEAAAGIAGLMKAALVLRHRKIPPNLHFERPNPEIPFAELCVRVPTTLEPWPSTSGPARAAVNSFGYGGTNAHALLEEAPVGLPEEEEADSPSAGRPVIVPISAHTETALKDLAGRVAFFLRAKAGEGISLADMAYSTALRRTHHDWRLALTVESVEQLWEGLQLFGIGETSPGVSSGHTEPEKPSGPVFVCTGMGPQWWGMGRELRQKEPVFRDAFDECEALFHEISGWSLIEALSTDRRTSRVGETQVAQPANFALQVSLGALLHSWGVKPVAVVGHSVGEVAAAYLAGVLSLRDAVKVSFHRSRLQQKLVGDGAMLAVGLPVAEADSLLEGSGEVSVAAVNSPSSFTLSGNKEALNAIAATLDKAEVFNRFLRVEVAYHSCSMDPIREEIIRSLGDIEPRQEVIPLYSTVSGGQLSGLKWGSEYWWRNVRLPVQFAQAVGALLTDGYRHFLEVGPHPVLGGAMKECFLHAGVEGESVSSLRREEPELFQVMDALGKLYTLGMPIDWKAIGPPGGQFLSLPAYPWQRETCWRESKKSVEDRLGAKGHIFFNNDFRSPQPGWTVEINEQFFPYLDDHRLWGNPVFPGAGYVEAGLALHRRIFDEIPCVLEDLEFTSLLMKEEKNVQLLGVTYSPLTQRYDVSSRPDDDDSPWKRHAGGRVRPLSGGAAPRLELDLWRERCSSTIPEEVLYERLQKRGLGYSGFFRTIRQFWRNQEEFLLQIEGEASIGENREDYLLHPTILDALFQGMLAVAEGTNPLVPVSIERITFYAPPGRRCWGYGTVTRRTETSLEATIGICDDGGAILAEAEKVCCRVIAGQPEKEGHSLFYRFQWNSIPVVRQEAGEVDPARVLVFSWNDEEWMQRILSMLAQRGHSCMHVILGDRCEWVGKNRCSIRSGNSGDLDHLLGGSGERYDFALVLTGAASADGCGLCSFDEVLFSCLSFVGVVQSLTGTDGGIGVPLLQIVTRGAQFVGGEEGEKADLAHAPLWGLGALIENEYPGISCRLIDLPRSRFHDEEDALITELFSNLSETEVAFRSGERFVRELIHENNDKEAINSTEEVESTRSPVELELGMPGRVESLIFKEAPRKPPGRGEIEIAVDTAALNYKDFSKVYGRLPPLVTEDTYFEDCLGMECSGTVVGVGEGVEQFQNGDEVVTALRGAFRTYATIPVTWVVPKPSCLSMEQAPVFIGYLTAVYSLIDVARLEKGEKVLIHNASGGVGLAAVQVARRVGAEIFASAGSKEKRDFLASLGLDYVADSRTLAFGRDVRRWTGGRGVDVVLSALGGDALIESLGLLAPGGRYVDLGKLDIAENHHLPMKVFNRNLTFSGLDIDRMSKERPQVVQRVWQEIGRGFEEKAFSPIPVEVFPAAKIGDAFRHMAQSRHIGKIVVKMKEQEVPVLRGKAEYDPVRKEATYLITGGTGGFGLEVARWLVSRGAGSLVLASRRGSAAPGVARAVAEMEREGACVHVAAVDIADSEQVISLVKDVEAKSFPLRGVVHAAMVLDDGLLANMSREQFARVMAPKVAGAINLHRATLDSPLDLFVCFSSVSSLVGNRGQANYVAANSFLDAFCFYRRSRGLPGVTVNWGALGEIGVVARSPEVGEMLEAEGIRTLTTAQALEAFGHVLERNPAQAGVFDVDWQRWKEVHPAAARSSRFGSFIKKDYDEGDDPVVRMERELVSCLAKLNPEERGKFVADLLSRQLAKVLRFPLERIDVYQSVTKFGIDSLTTLELILSLKAEHGIVLSAGDLSKQPSLIQLSEWIVERLFSNP